MKCRYRSTDKNGAAPEAAGLFPTVKNGGSLIPAALLSDSLPLFLFPVPTARTGRRNLHIILASDIHDFFCAPFFYSWSATFSPVQILHLKPNLFSLSKFRVCIFLFPFEKNHQFSSLFHHSSTSYHSLPFYIGAPLSKGAPSRSCTLSGSNSW